MVLVLPFDIVAYVSALGVVLKQDAFLYHIGNVAKAGCPAEFWHGGISDLIMTRNFCNGFSLRQSMNAGAVG